MSTHPRDDKRRPLVFLCFALGAILAPPACTQRTEVSLGSQPPVTGTFVTPDAEAPEAASGLTQYCPSDECPTGHTTCPLSTFRCEVNLLTDRNNCGACGVVCPASEKGALFECVEGRCAMQCRSGFGDCDGVPDNGCEVTFATNDNCQFCGDKCAPDKPCSAQAVGHACGCPEGEDLCFNGLYTECTPLNDNDRHCGACGVVCDAGIVQNNTYQGCADGACGKAKCIQDWGDCDGDVRNGCETILDTNENCAKCGNACPADQECRYVQRNFMTPVLECTCPAGQEFCAFAVYKGLPSGLCRDLRTDNLSCGACGLQCASDEKCDFGVCRIDCRVGTEDCNGSRRDGCEVNTNSDPNNCGGCGVRCDGVAGQACVGGQCVVKPCDEVDAGGETTR